MPLAAQAHTCALHTRSVCRTLASSSHSPSHMCTSPSMPVPPHSSTQTCVSHALTCCVSLIHPPLAHMPPCLAHTPIPVAHDPSLAHSSHTTHAPMSRTPAPRHIPYLALAPLHTPRVSCTATPHHTDPSYVAHPLPITYAPCPHTLTPHHTHMHPHVSHSHTHTHTPRAHSSTCLTHTAPSYATPQPCTLTPVPCAPCLAPPFARTRCHMHVHSPRTLTLHTHTCTLTPFHFTLCTLTVSHIHHTLIVSHGCTLAPSPPSPQQQSSGCGSDQWGWAEELGALG